MMNTRNKYGMVRGSVVLVAGLCMMASLSTCTKDYVTGKRTFSLISEGQEIEMGRAADVDIVAQYGLYDDESLAKYVDRLGQSLARVSQRPQLEYTFRVLDSPVINAFALPGGWVYVTRGILAHLNSEAELAGVIGHEVGHVVARHGAEQMSRQILAGIGVGLLEKAPILGNVAGAGVGVLFLSFSRGQESESDQLGVEYSTRVGYDAHRMADFFGTLDRMSKDSGQRLPNFLSTHPDPGDRRVRVAQLADQWQSQIDYKPRKEKSGEFLKRLDGISYGPDPRQGFVERGHFYHPDLRFQFSVPDKWEVHNSPALVDMVNEDQSAMITFAISRESPAAAAADSFVARSKVVVVSRKPVRIHRYQAIAIESTVQGRSGELRILSHFIAYDGGVYVFHGFTRAASWGSYVGTFQSVAGGFDRVTDSRVLGRQPARLRVRKAPRSGDFTSVIQAMGVVEGNFGEHAVLNGRSLSDPIEKGAWIKIIDRRRGR